MRRPRGIPIIVCNCTAPQGWPLAVKQAGPLSNQSRGSGLEWLVSNTRSSYYDNDSKVRLTGQCPQCKRFFDLRGEAEYGDDAFADFMVAIGEDYEIEIITPHVSYLQDNKHNKHMGTLPDGLWHQHPYRVKDLPAKNTTYYLWVNCEVRHEFAKFINRVVKEGWDRSLIPDWHPDGTEDQFDEWLDEPDAVVETKKEEEERKRGLPPRPPKTKWQIWLDAKGKDKNRHRPAESIQRLREDREIEALRARDGDDLS